MKLGKAWNDDCDRQYVELREAGKKEHEIAELMGFSRQTLRRKARQLDYPKRKRGKPKGMRETLERDQSLIKDHLNGMSAKALVHKYKISPSRVYQLTVRYRESGKV